MGFVELIGPAHARGVAFLEHHLTSSMFPLANIRDHGQSDHPRAVTLYGVGDPLRGVLALSREGVLFPQLPDPQDWAAIRPLVQGREICGCFGRAEQVEGCLAALGLTDAPKSLDNDEPLMQLKLSELIAPEQPGKLAPLSTDESLAVTWRQHYGQEILGWSAAEAPQRASTDIALYIGRDSHRFLCINDTPVAMTGFNAEYPGIVQIGGVYTPPDLRGRGYARQALALHLQEAHHQGAERSVLFASGPAAEAAYSAIGYQRIGRYRLCQLATPVLI